MMKSVVFDIGNVLVHFRWRELFADLGFEGEKFEIIANATVLNPWWNEFDRGLMTLPELIDKFAEKAPEYREDIEQIFEHGGEIVSLYDYAIPWIRDLKSRGYQVYVLSNWSKPVYEKVKDTHLRFLSEVDGGIMSFREGLIKPEREIYQLLCDRYNLDPKEAVFLDDNAANVQAARDFGLHAIHFQSYEQAKEKLDKLLEEK